MARALITHARLMSASEDCVERALRSDDSHSRLIASRILDDPASWRRWEVEHSAMMRVVADHGRADVQIRELKNTSFQLVHTKAPFDYLREQQIRGESRRVLVAHLRPSRSYTEALLNEHAAYLRAACSLLCTSHVGVVVAQDGVFEDPMRRYEELYSDYFRAYCSATVGVANDDDRDAQRALLPYLKLKLSEYRRVLLRMPPLHPGLLIEASLRQKTGDTQKLRRPTLFKRDR